MTEALNSHRPQRPFMGHWKPIPAATWRRFKWRAADDACRSPGCRGTAAGLIDKRSPDDQFPITRTCRDHQTGKIFPGNKSGSAWQYWVSEKNPGWTALLCNSGSLRYLTAVPPIRRAFISRRIYLHGDFLGHLLRATGSQTPRLPACAGSLNPGRSRGKRAKAFPRERRRSALSLEPAANPNSFK